LTKFFRIGLSALLLLVAFGFVLSRTDWSTFAKTASDISSVPVMLAVALMLIGALLASWRLQLIASDLGYRLTFRDSVSALSLGQLAGSLFFQLAGQLMARSALLSRRMVPVSGTIIITGYERFSALIVSILLAAAGAAYLFGQIHIDLAEGGTTFLKLVIGFFVVIVAGALWGWGHMFSDFLPLVTKRNLLRFSRSLVISLSIQVATMGSYFVLVKSLSPGTPNFSLVAASALVMLAASLPISLAGWGMREMSAIFALGAIGLSAQYSLMVAVLIGAISLGVVGLLAFTAVGHRHRSAPAHSRRLQSPINYAALLDYTLPLVATTAVFFQIFLPVNNGLININLADPVVILGGSLFVIHHFGKDWPTWRLPNFTGHVLAATVVVILAYLHGLASFGWSEWAFANKLIGWFVLLCYGATGALIVRHAGRDGMDLLLRTFVVTAVSIVAIELVVFAAYRSGAEFLKAIVSFPFLGFSQNRNAFGFQLLLTTCILLSVHWPRRWIFLTLAFVGIWYCGSRSVFLALPFVLGAAAYMVSISWRDVLIGLAVGVGIVLLVGALPTITATIQSIFTEASSGGPDRILDVLAPTSGAASDSERMKSLLGGWELFLNDPIFGAGLGAFIEQQRREGHLLVIHSVPLWLLAETGLIGFAIIVSPIVRILLAEISARKTDIGGTLIVLIIVSFAIVANIHDIMYQRVFWLLLGASLACLPKMAQQRRAATKARHV
jgi:uncharacterized membrane protein YbhN (UPF0104 family)